MAQAKKPKFVKSSVADAVSSAFSDIEGLKDELQEWYDNIHENFQNGTKGEALQEAISNLESDSEVECPEALESIECSYSIVPRCTSRPKRRDQAINYIEGAIEGAEEEKSRLDALEFNDDGKLIDDDEKIVVAKEGEVEPITETERDDAVSEIETFISDCESARDNWMGVEFPGMFG